MSKALQATCLAGVVKIGALPVSDAVVFSEGVAASSGVAFVEDGETFYFPKNSPDLKTTLEKLITALQKVSTVLSSLDTRGYLIAATAGVPGPPLSAADIVSLNTAVTELGTLKESLK